jgi:hypothetical protein
LEGALPYLQDSKAVDSTSGCGNLFQTPVPFTCSGAPSTPMPGGRLTLCASPPCPAVMTGDVTGATTIYYVPYLTQQVPVYNITANSFGPVDIGSSGLSVALDSSNQLLGRLYDIFLETVRTGSAELCVGPAWSSSTAGSSSRGTGYNTAQLAQVNGVWANAAGLAAYEVAPGTPAVTTPCPIYACTYLGTIYTTANGQTSQQFAPASAGGGSNPCLCLYNAYNRVALTSRSNDTVGYTYNNSSGWRSMNNSASNRVTAVDGLAQMQIVAQLTDALGNATLNARTAEMGIEFNVSGTSLAAPLQSVVAALPTSGSYGATAPSTPYLGLWYAQAVESAPGTGAAAANFNGGIGASTPNFQQLSVQVAD